MHTRRVCVNQRETVMSGEKMAAVETPQDEIEHLRKVLDELQTNQAEHALHLDQLAHRADLERAERAADRMRLNSLAQEVKDLRDNADRMLAEQVKECFDTIEAHRVWLRKIEQQAGAYSENTGAVLADIMGRVETLEVKDIQRSEDIATANKATDLLAQSSKDLWRKVWKIEEAIDAMKYRRMVGNMFRRVADLVDGG